MHWSVGMLLHDVCVFFYKEVKKRDLLKIGCAVDVRFPTFSFLFFPLLSFSLFFNCSFCQHGAVDPGDIPFAPILCLNKLFCALVIIPALM